MWIAWALVAAVAAGATAVLAKVGMRGVDTYLATALRTVVVLAFAWLMVAVVGSAGTAGQLSGRTLAFLAASGLATGASWLCYFRALQLGPVTGVAALDKSSTVLTMVLGITLLGESGAPLVWAGMALLAVGTALMVIPRHRFPQPQEPDAVAHVEAAGSADAAPPGTGPGNSAASLPGGTDAPASGAEPEDRAAPLGALAPAGRSWAWWATGSAVFAALTAILGKVGIENVESNLGTALRTCVVLVMAWGLVFALGRQHGIGALTRRNWTFIGLSGLATGVSWLAFFHALQSGPASVVVPIDKLSIVVTVAFAALVLHERVGRRTAIGLALLVGGTLLAALGQ